MFDDLEPLGPIDEGVITRPHPGLLVGASAKMSSAKESTITALHDMSIP